MGNAAIAVGSQKEHLRLPAIGCERPTVAEDNGLSFAPILVIDLCAIFHCDRALRPLRDRAHLVVSFPMMHYHFRTGIGLNGCLGNQPNSSCTSRLWKPALGKRLWTLFT